MKSIYFKSEKIADKEYNLHICFTLMGKIRCFFGPLFINFGLYILKGLEK